MSKTVLRVDFIEYVIHSMKILKKLPKSRPFSLPSFLQFPARVFTNTFCLKLSFFYFLFFFDDFLIIQCMRINRYVLTNRYVFGGLRHRQHLWQTYTGNICGRFQVSACKQILFLNCIFRLYIDTKLNRILNSNIILYLAQSTKIFLVVSFICSQRVATVAKFIEGISRQRQQLTNLESQQSYKSVAIYYQCQKSHTVLKEQHVNK